MRTSVNKAIYRGLNYLEKEYKAKLDFGFEALFPSVLVLDCLNSLSYKKGKKLKTALAQRILSQKSDHWSFNYWFKDSKRFKTEPYPDDLDDTFCALAALHRFNKKIIKGNDIAVIVNLLLLCEQQEGGPYRTWLVPQDNFLWSDCDVAVNSNVAYFLSLQEVELDSITEIAESALITLNLKSPYYVGRLPLLYFLSRWYKGKVKKKLKTLLASHLKPEASTLELGLSISSLVRLGSARKVAASDISRLLALQKANGSWPTALFYCQSKQKGKQRMDKIGSPCLTTAFVLEALSLWLESTQTENISQKKEYSAYIRQVKVRATRELAALPDPLRESAQRALGDILNHELAEVIILTPVSVFKALKKEYAQKISKEVVILACLANLYGWCAYTLLDDILDLEGEIALLPTVLAFYRKMELTFARLLHSQNLSYLRLYQKTMDRLDNANLWELRHCRFTKKINVKKLPKYRQYKQLAEKSLGHALSGLVLLAHSDIGTNSKDTKHLCSFFCHYLIARQMNDDAHDWEEDLKAGRINSANSVLLKLFSENKKVVKITTRNLKSLELIFWQNVIPQFGTTILSHLTKAEHHLEQISVFDNKEFFLEMLKKIAKSAKKALEESKKTQAFVSTFFSQS